MKEDTGMRDFSYREKAMQRNQELFHLREQAAMLEHARNRLDQLVFQQQELREKARQLDALRVKESNDVDKLQGRSFICFTGYRGAWRSGWNGKKQRHIRRQ